MAQVEGSGTLTTSRLRTWFGPPARLVSPPPVTFSAKTTLSPQFQPASPAEQAWPKNEKPPIATERESAARRSKHAYPVKPHTH